MLAQEQEDEMTELENRCPGCDSLVLVWADNSGGITVNFRCFNLDCEYGKPPWDTDPPANTLNQEELHIILRRLKRIKANYDMRIGLARKAGADPTELHHKRRRLERARKTFLAERGKGL